MNNINKINDISFVIIWLIMLDKSQRNLKKKQKIIRAQAFFIH